MFSVLVISAALLFASAGTFKWPAAWIYISIHSASIFFAWLFVFRTRSSLMAERARVRPDTKTWDRFLAPLASVYLPAVTLVLAGIDYRVQWTQDIPSVLAPIGIALSILGYAIVISSMRANAFFSSVVRIQSDRGHTVAQSGPYSVVRHPGYVGMILFTIAAPLILGSILALVPALLSCIALVTRTWLEDRTLQAELPGYRDYTRSVRHRLIPRIF